MTTSENYLGTIWCNILLFKVIFFYGKHILTVLDKPDAANRSYNLGSWTISVEAEYHSWSRMENHHANSSSSSIQREEADQRLQEVNDLSEILSSHTPRGIHKNTKIHARSANWRRNFGISYLRYSCCDYWMWVTWNNNNPVITWCWSWWTRRNWRESKFKIRIE